MKNARFHNQQNHTGIKVDGKIETMHDGRGGGLCTNNSKKNKNKNNHNHNKNESYLDERDTTFYVVAYPWRVGGRGGEDIFQPSKTNTKKPSLCSSPLWFFLLPLVYKVTPFIY